MSTVKTLNIDKCLLVLKSNFVGHLGYVFGQSPHIVPITYFHDPEEKCLISYSNEGHKMDAMRKYSSVAFQVEEIDGLQEWRSVMVLGKFEELDGSDAKRFLHKFAGGVQSIMEQRGEKTPKFIKDFSSKMDDRGLPIVYKIIIHDIVGKYRTDFP